MQKAEPLVDIIIVTLNKYEHTENCVQSLLQSTYKNIKIILVDNNSSLSTYNKFKEKYKTNNKITFVRLKNNVGYGGGCNSGVKESKGKYILFLNNDTKIAPSAIQKLVNAMEKSPEFGACQPKIKDMNKPAYFEYAGGSGGYMDIFGYPFTRGRIFNTVEKDKGQYDDEVKIVWCTGTAFFVKRDVIEKVGLFDEMFFMYVEENDLCWRINSAGWKLKVIPSAVVYHEGMTTMNAYSSKSKAFYLHRNGLIMLCKNYPVIKLLYILPFRLLLDLATLFYYLAVYRPNVSALIRAYGSFLGILPKTLKARSTVKKIKSSAHLETYKGCIPFEYFILGKKTFSEIYVNKNTT